MKVNRTTANIRSNGSLESLILRGRALLSQHSIKLCICTYAAKRSGRSRYCQYSRFGIGSSKEAGNDRRLSRRREGQGYSRGEVEKHCCQ